MENEPDRVWNKQMYSLIREMIHYRNSIPENGQLDKTVVSNYEQCYREILLKAKEEYEALKKEKEQLDAGKDFYAYQYQELKALNLYEGEEEEIEAQIDVLKNYDKVYSLHQEANQILRSDYRRFIIGIKLRSRRNFGSKRGIPYFFPSDSRANIGISVVLHFH